MKHLLWLPLILVVFAQQPTATFEGRVVDSVTGQPIAGAHVTISSNLYGPPESARQTAPRPTSTTVSERRIVNTTAGQPAPAPLPQLTNRDVFTDAQGKFLIEGVPAVAYTIGTAAAGYVYQIYGQKTPFGGLTPVKLVAGANAANGLVIRLDRAADVTGTITSPDRKPMSPATVFLLRTTFSLIGGERFYVNGEAQTDEAGKFQLKGVAEGEYSLIAGVEAAPARGARGMDLHAWTFYPGVADGALAAKVNVSRGGHTDIGVLSLQKQEPRAIRGKVLDSRTGKPPATARLTLIGRAPFDRAGRSSEEPVRATQNYDPATGAFEFGNLRSGRYRIDVSLPAQPNAQPVGPALTAVPQDAFAFVNVTTTDVNDLALTVPSASTLRTKIVVSGEEMLSIFDKTSPARPQFRLTPTQPLQPTTSLVFVTEDAFESRTPLDGGYRVSLGPLAENHYISELRLNGVRAQNHILEIQPNSTSELQIVVRRDGGQVEGTVVDARNRPVAGVRGIVLPDPLPETLGQYYPLNSNPDGKFTLRGVATGNYKAYVWEGLGELQLYDRELWRRTSSSATPIRIDPGSRITTYVKVIVP